MWCFSNMEMRRTDVLEKEREREVDMSNEK
jgi:hypothetical protein